MVWTSLPPTHRARREDEPGVKTKTEKESTTRAELQYLSADLCYRACGLCPRSGRRDVEHTFLRAESCSHAQSPLPGSRITASDTLQSGWNPTVRTEGMHTRRDMMIVWKCIIEGVHSKMSNVPFILCLHSFLITAVGCRSLWKTQRALEMVAQQHIKWICTGQKTH